MARQPLHLPNDVKMAYPAFHRIVRKPFPVNIPLTSHDPKLDTDFNVENQFQRKLKSTRIDRQDVFVGVPGFKSLDLLAIAGKDTHTQYKEAIIYDINMREIAMMETILDLIRHNENPKDFIKAYTRSPKQKQGRPPRVNKYDMFHKPPQYGEDPDLSMFGRLMPIEKKEFFSAPGHGYYPPNAAILAEQMAIWNGAKERISDESWLQPENYRRIREMVRAGGIKTAIIDLADTDRLKSLKQSITHQGYRIGHCYVSSVLNFEANANLNTDYFGRVTGNNRIQQAHNFCDNLIDFADEGTQFIISMPSPLVQIYHTYQLQFVDKNHIITEYKNKIPKTAPDYKDMDYHCYFTTHSPSAGNTQAWRLVSFYEQDENGKPINNLFGHKQKYFRIITENFPDDPEYLREQVKQINKVLARLENQRSSSISFHSISSEALKAIHERCLLGAEDEPDKGMHSEKYPVMASDRFTWGEGANPNTIKYVITEVNRALEKLGKQPTPEITVLARHPRPSNQQPGAKGL